MSSPGALLTTAVPPVGHMAYRPIEVGSTHRTRPPRRGLTAPLPHEGPHLLPGVAGAGRPSHLWRSPAYALLPVALLVLAVGCTAPAGTIVPQKHEVTDAPTEQTSPVPFTSCTTWDDHLARAGAAPWSKAPGLPYQVPLIVTRMVGGDWTAEDKEWTRRLIGALFAQWGQVTAIWKKHGISLRLVTARDCEYRPAKVRLDGRFLDAMPTPESGIPWAPGLFSQVNRFLVASDPPALHILFWRSLEEPTATARAQSSDPDAPGYARAAGRGGPVVWIDAKKCFQLADLCQPISQCPLLLAHEIGHALGLHHVDSRDDNLMSWRHLNDELTSQQIERVRDEVRQLFTRR